MKFLHSYLLASRIRPWSGLLLLLVLAGCTSAPVTSTPRRSGRPLIAVISAFAPETAANEAFFRGTNAAVESKVIRGVRFTQVRFEGHDLLLFATGVSTVNAAMTTQLALDQFPVTHVLFAGIAGGINPAHAIGDVVIPDRWFHHSEAVYANPKPDGSGYILPDYFKPHYENYGYIFPADVSVIREGLTEPERKPSFEADPDLLAAARRAIPAVPPLEWSNHRSRVSVGGVGITGPVFMDNREYRKWAFRVWQADCLDMESTAIAQVCWANRKPFLIVRSLSDLAGGQEGVNPADFTEVPISKHATLVLREVIRALPH
jgi:adenosylhomocysteine nucleosidase